MEQPDLPRTSAQVWATFPQDPRDPASAVLRASDADRDRVQQVLADGFADGRLDREEYDERSTSALSARTLGQLPPLLADLLPEHAPVRSPGSVPLVDASGSELRRRAREKFTDERRNALLAFLGPTLICWAIWVFTGFSGSGFHAGFAWPLFPTFFVALNLIKVLAGRRDIEARELRRLEQRQEAAITGRDQPPSEG